MARSLIANGFPRRLDRRRLCAIPSATFDQAHKAGNAVLHRKIFRDDKAGRRGVRRHVRSRGGPARIWQYHATGRSPRCAGHGMAPRKFSRNLGPRSSGREFREISGSSCAQSSKRVTDGRNRFRALPARRCRCRKPMSRKRVNFLARAIPKATFAQSAHTIRT